MTTGIASIETGTMRTIEAIIGIKVMAMIDMPIVATAAAITAITRPGATDTMMDMLIIMTGMRGRRRADTTGAITTRNIACPACLAIHRAR